MEKHPPFFTDEQRKALLTESVKPFLDLMMERDPSEAVFQMVMIESNGEASVPLTLFGDAAEPGRILPTHAITGLIGRFNSPWVSVFWASAAEDDLREVIAVGDTARFVEEGDQQLELLSFDYNVVDKSTAWGKEARLKYDDVCQEIVWQMICGFRITYDKDYATLDEPTGEELVRLNHLTDLASADFSEEDLENPSFQMAAIDTGAEKPSLMQLPGVPNDSRDMHIYCVIPTIMREVGAEAVAISAVVTRKDDDGAVDGTMTFAISKSGAGLTRFDFADMDDEDEFVPAAGPQVAALRNALGWSEAERPS